MQASCAAKGTATASAAQRGSHLAASRSRSGGARKRIPAVASTDSANPAESTSHGSTRSRLTVATPSARAPRARPCRPSDSSATDPIAAARTTLGSGRASSTNPPTPRIPTTVRARPRTPRPRATTSRKPTTSVRLVPDTAARWVSPHVRKSSTTVGLISRSSPTTRAGTSARASGPLPETASRMPARTASATPNGPAGGARTSGRADPDSRAATLGSSDGPSRPRAATTEPSSRCAQVSSASTTTGARVAKTRPRPVTWRTASRTTTKSPCRPSLVTGSEVTRASSRTTARCSASRATGPVELASARTSAHPATAEPTSRHASASRTGLPRLAAAPTAARAAASSAAASQPGTSRASSPPAQAAAPSTTIRRSDRASPDPTPDSSSRRAPTGARAASAGGALTG